MIPKFLAASLALAFAAVAAAPSDAAASNYPPDYDVCGRVDAVTTGPFEVIRDLADFTNHVKLTVAYRGYLRDYFPDEDINIYIRLNGNDAFIPAYAGTNDDAYIYLDSGPRGCFYCGNGGYNPNPSCGDIEFPPYSSGTWVCGGPSEIEEHIFVWAFNPQGYLNAWDVEVAAEANGWWDSNYGANYYARLEPASCW